jgi:sugar lactone lactonase YvrE
MMAGVASRGVRRLVAFTVVALVTTLAACSAGDDDPSPNASPTTATTAPAGGDRDAGPVVFSPQGNNLEAYTGVAPFDHQTVITRRDDDPDGWDINGQICFLDDRTFVAGEDTGQPDPPAGWAAFALRGDAVGNFSAERVARFVPTYQPTDESPDNYGCGVLSDGRVVTTVIGNNASGPEDGELLLWFPPFDGEVSTFCVLDAAIGTAQGIAVDADDNVYVASARGSTGGVLRYRPPFPTSADAAGECGRRDGAGSPMADVVARERFITPSEANFLSSPNAIAAAPDGSWFVSSIINGVISQFTPDGTFVRTVLAPPDGERLGARPYSTGTPLGLAVAPDGTLFYADLGLVLDDGIGPGERTGSLRRIRFEDGEPLAPETVADGLTFPDGLGIVP